jgi:hypothetical protein
LLKLKTTAQTGARYGVVGDTGPPAVVDTYAPGRGAEHATSRNLAGRPALYAGQRGAGTDRQLVVHPQDILAATVHAVRAALGGLKGGAKPPMASPTELMTAIRSADYLARDARWPDPR